ncbi:MAG: hypothetical protein ACRD2X_26760 [Vicinamibacteraceae bacterium]
MPQIGRAHAVLWVKSARVARGVSYAAGRNRPNLRRRDRSSAIVSSGVPGGLPLLVALDVRIVESMLAYPRAQQTQRSLNFIDEELRKGLEVSGRGVAPDAWWPEGKVS